MTDPGRVTLSVETIAAGGDGVARHDGLVVLTPRTAPGDRVLADVRVVKRLGRGHLVELLAPGPDRIDPPCPHYVADRCGGCQVQHLTYEAQLEAKQGIIRDALVRIGKRDVPAPPAIVPAPRQWRYRRKLTLAMEWRGDAWVAGLYPYDDPRHPFALGDCPITDERVVATWRQIMAASEHLPRARTLRGAVRLVGESESTFVLEGGREWPAAAEFAAAVPSLTGVWWQPEHGRRRLVHERTNAPAGASFVQVNADVAAALHAHVVERARAWRAATVVDAYAGTGETAVPLAEDGARVTAIELDRDAAAVCRARLPRGSQSLAGRVEDLLPRALPADLVLLNPPRAGVDASIAAALVDARPSGIVYTSCNPATLARDVARLPGYRIASLVGFDMFPQTAHVETVCELALEGT